ncbi:MAG: hypothetical protein ACK58T_15470 [Phycisphaerae bacterium]
MWHHSSGHRDTQTKPESVRCTSTGGVFCGRCHRLAKLILLKAIQIADYANAGSRIQSFLDGFRQ